MPSPNHLPFLWDYDLNEVEFLAILHGEKIIGSLDRDWAAVRLLDYAPYREIVRLLGFRALIEGWPRWREKVRSPSRRRGLDFLAEWLPTHHPEKI
jgi:hypothetical protein